MTISLCADKTKIYPVADKGTSNAQQTVSRMADDDVDRELRGTGPAKVEVIDTGCDWVKPIYGTDHDWDSLDKQTKKDILAHNKAWQVNCDSGEANTLKN
ncbi:hypothetical protein MOW87_001885 [Citrobacter freundii]|uniref:hypothetical protein n=1 Tax=Citrobacter TaxID=544 RepID=UPI001E56E390|nr:MULTISPECIES: hypothetical protein [Citrobacter]MDM3241058.1 hypothetical protein [Citrobacter sp. Cf081]MDR4051577.1 hypothetical protein [Citrobacter sp.]WLV32638.1 hypothetical protein M2O47_14060 [Citrobacter freundii]